MMFKVRVQFHQDFVKVNGNTIVVGLTSPPRKGKANLKVIKKLAKYFNVSSSKVKIVSGFKSKTKLVEISNEK